MEAPLTRLKLLRNLLTAENLQTQSLNTRIQRLEQLLLQADIKVSLLRKERDTAEKSLEEKTRCKICFEHQVRNFFKNVKIFDFR